MLMNDVLEDDLIDVWEFKSTQNLELKAKNALQQRWVKLRQSFYDSYAPGEEIDVQLQRKHIERLDNQRRLALIDFPESLELIDDWLDIYLPLPKVALPFVDQEEDYISLIY